MGNIMTECERCRWRYPGMLLQPMATSKGRTGPICGICALEVSNEVLGVTREKFTGEMAEEMRQSALDWRKRHPDMAPKEKAQEKTDDAGRG